MKHYRIIAILIPLIFSGCAASHSDKELVDSYYNDQQKTIESDVDQLVNSYSAKVVTQYYPEPYFNPTKPIPHYYALKLDEMGIPYPKELVYDNADYNFYKEQLCTRQK
ncbi:hypothetical protein [Acinetobacter radioresistens]|uniref:hypothetical protein n=1 Tax=Acinetobacter radioresistens TaxID=40216 RepID=UPI0021CDBABA|nr:hypothetical protein [Acinetobacter radioresistens]MCU4568068.1 hypothetical protein [Acinetobacter radioresistens]